MKKGILLLVGLFVSTTMIYSQNVKEFKLLEDFTANKKNVWSYGHGTVGGDFVASKGITKKETASIATTNEDWKGVYFNPANGKDINMSQGLVLKSGMVMMHPGNKTDHLSKIRFTAPKSGTYNVTVKWTAIDAQAKKSWTWVYTNAVSATGKVYDFTPKGFKEVFTKGITGHNNSANFTKAIEMTKGEVISFEMGNGGDQYFDDALSIDLNISAVNNTLYAGETLNAGERLVSPNNKFILIMQTDGNLCVYNFVNGKQGDFVWGSMKYGFNNGNLMMQTDGNLVVYDGSHKPQWSSDTYSLDNTPKEPVKLVLGNDGSLKLFPKSGLAVWSSK